MTSDRSPHGAGRTIRVFISSTFRDMIEERDELMTHTWPELCRLCEERHVELVEVDLRWGIAESQSTRRETLKLCLDEIRACRPFFIGRLGERYGWTPGDDAFTADKDHPAVASSLNNLAAVLYATNRLAEAEPVMRRVVEILLKSTRETRHLYPHLQVAVDNYAGLLGSIGRSREEVAATLKKMAPWMF